MINSKGAIETDWISIPRMASHFPKPQLRTRTTCKALQLNFSYDTKITATRKEDLNKMETRIRQKEPDRPAVRFPKRRVSAEWRSKKSGKQSLRSE